MSCETASRNATAPEPGIAPGAQTLDVRAIARAIGRHGRHPALPATIPGFDAPFFQAGLAGYSDAAMRLIARRHGCPLCVTEALLDRTLLSGGRGFAKADLGELHDNVPGGEDDHPLVGQLMGSDPGEMAAAAVKMVEQGARAAREYRELAGGGAIGNGQLAIGRDAPEASLPSHSDPIANCQLPIATFQAIDINLACPVKKIAKKARGGHWLAEPQGAIAILKAVRDALPERVPCTLKIRRSYDDTPEMARNFMRIFDAAYDLGYAWATVHARTVQQKYVGPSRWDLLRDIVQQRPGRVVFGSGDIWQVQDIFRMIGYTGVAGVSVARGCIGNPWIFRQARDMMAGEDPRPPTIAEQRQVLEDHFALALRVNATMRDPEHVTGKTMRKFAIRFAQHHPAGEEVRKRFIGVKGLEEWRGVLGEWYEQ
ncbi:MAG: tRNA-dihydrouridine synthase family protein [Phycisphaeraceae bacterium]|nr:tRNA-dihydrouridine synthase family protein [Phycisphaeraceae bacterium]